MKRPFLQLFLALAAIAFSAALGFYLRQENPHSRPRPEVNPRHTPLTKGTERAKAKPGRHLNYPYSVIPGGAHSPGELKQAVLHDPVVRRHYADFQVQRTQVIRAKAARFVYVSFRKGNRVYWTSKRVRIAEGEPLLTDGVHMARTRCGNRISDMPQPNTTLDEPPLHILDTPEDSAAGLGEAPLPIVVASNPIIPVIEGIGSGYAGEPSGIGGGASGPGAPGTGGGGGFAPFGGPMLSGFPISDRPHTPGKEDPTDPGNPGNPGPPVPPTGPPVVPPITPVPEPSTLGLLAISGIAGLWLYFRKQPVD